MLAFWLFMLTGHNNGELPWAISRSNCVGLSVMSWLQGQLIIKFIGRWLILAFVHLTGCSFTAIASPHKLRAMEALVPNTP